MKRSKKWGGKLGMALRRAERPKAESPAQLRDRASHIRWAAQFNRNGQDALRLREYANQLEAGANAIEDGKGRPRNHAAAVSALQMHTEVHSK
jgi:hypothetical protein